MSKLRDIVMTWPSLSVKVQLMPWHWRIWFWRDWDCTSSCSLIFGPIEIAWFANRPLFREP